MTLQMHYQEKFEQGLEQGLEQGDRKRALLTAENMIKIGGLSLENIAFCSGLPLEEVKKLKEGISEF